MKRFLLTVVLLSTVLIGFAMKPKNYVEVNVPSYAEATHPEQLVGYYYGNNGTINGGVFEDGPIIRVPEGTTWMEITLTNPVYTSWSWTVSPSSNLLQTFPSWCCCRLQNSSGLDGTTIVITGEVAGYGTVTKTMAIQVGY